MTPTKVKNIHTHLSWKLMIKLCIILLTFTVKIETMCETSGFLQMLGSNPVRSSCEMCFFSFGERTIFLKCKHKLRCKNSTIEDSSVQGSQSNSMEHCEEQTGYIYDPLECQQICCQYFSSPNGSLFESINSSGEVAEQYCSSIEDQRKMAIIVSILFMIVPLSCIIVFLFLGYRQQRQNEMRRLNRTTPNARNNEESFIPESGIDIGKFNINQIGSEEISEQEPCTVCLDQNCNCVTKCGHFYHSTCLREWLVKRPRCPVCMSKQYNPIKIYCIHCKRGTSLRVLMHGPIKSEEGHHSNLSNTKKCESCENHKQQTDMLSQKSKQTKEEQQNVKEKETESTEISDERKLARQFIRKMKQKMRISSQTSKQHQEEEQAQSDRRLSQTSPSS